MEGRQVKGVPEGGGEGRDSRWPHLDLEPASRKLLALLSPRPGVHLVLGSGLGGLVSEVEDRVEVPFEELPGFPSPTVEGHAGRFVGGRLEGRPVLLQSGRYHVYEGHPMEVVLAPVRLARLLGIRTLLLTNAAGGIRRSLGPGDLVLLDDHMNLTWRSPLAGPGRTEESLPLDLRTAYDPDLQRRMLDAGRELEIRLHRGIYAAVAGPSYETPAEVRMLEALGADLVGMSTVPEALAARALGMRVLAVSMVTNRAAGLSDVPLDHREVVEVGRRAGGKLARLIRRLVGDLP